MAWKLKWVWPGLVKGGRGTSLGPTIATLLDDVRGEVKGMRCRGICTLQRDRARGQSRRLTCDQAFGLEWVGGRQLGMSSRCCERVGEGCSGCNGVEVRKIEGYFYLIC